MARTSLFACLCAGILLLQGGSAQVTTAEIYLPLAMGSESLMSQFKGSVVSTDGQTTVFAMSCTDGPCNPIAGGTGTITFTAAPDTYIYTASFNDGRSHDIRCTLKGCPSIDEVKCVETRASGVTTSLYFQSPTESARLPLLLDHEVPEPTPIQCPTTSVPAKTDSDSKSNSADGPKETGSNGGGDKDDSDKKGTGDDDEDDDDGNGRGDEGESDENGTGDDNEDDDGGSGSGDDDSAAFLNAPFLGLVAGAAVGVAALIL